MEERGVLGSLLAEAAAGRVCDADELLARLLKVLIDNDLLKLPGMRQFAAGCRQTALDGGGAVLAPGLQALLQHFQ